PSYIANFNPEEDEEDPEEDPVDYPANERDNYDNESSDDDNDDDDVKKDEEDEEEEEHQASADPSTIPTNDHFAVALPSSSLPPSVSPLICTDIAIISRKRSKLDNHGHGNGIECAKARRKLLKLRPLKYDAEILERAHTGNSNPSQTLVDTESKLGDVGDLVSDLTLYQSLAGSLHTEAKYHGVANVVVETCYVWNLLRELHTPLTSTKLVYCDNVSPVYLSSNSVQHQRTKHIEIDIHFVRDLVAAGQVRVLHVPSRYKYADIFTNGLSSALFEEFCTSLSVHYLNWLHDCQTTSSAIIELLKRLKLEMEMEVEAEVRLIEID
ncbi:ribonuclease H-like domain-containing protein, partial [Tanacetum coccineum]